jgi:hypothetical protein
VDGALIAFEASDSPLRRSGLSWIDLGAGWEQMPSQVGELWPDGLLSFNLSQMDRAILNSSDALVPFDLRARTSLDQ